MSTAVGRQEHLFSERENRIRILAHKPILIPNIYKDLMCGNWISFKGFWVNRVDLISHGIIQVKNNKGIFSDEIGIEGVKIEPHWLIELGFVLDRREIKGKKASTFEDEFILTTPNCSFKVISDFQGGWIVFRTIPEGVWENVAKQDDLCIAFANAVHELQNVVYWHGNKFEL